MLAQWIGFWPFVQNNVQVDNKFLLFDCNKISPGIILHHSQNKVNIFLCSILMDNQKIEFQEYVFEQSDF